MQDNYNILHEKVKKDVKYSGYYQELTRLMDVIIENDIPKKLISNTCKMVLISAEATAYREGFKECIRFLVNVLVNTGEPVRVYENDIDFIEALEEFLARYRENKIVNIKSTSGETERYKDLHKNK